MSHELGREGEGEGEGGLCDDSQSRVSTIKPFGKGLDHSLPRASGWFATSIYIIILYCEYRYMIF